MALRKKTKVFEYKHFKEAADKIGCEPAVIEAIVEKEGCNNDPYFTYRGQRKLRILFERHVFWRRLEAAGKDPTDYLRRDSKCSDVLAQSGYKRYGSFQKQYDRREQASMLDQSAAMESCSYSGFQILGYHWKSLGYESVQDFVSKMDAGVENHIDAFVRFIELNDLGKHLINKDFESFAAKYNGPKYYVKGYHIELSRIYQRIIARDLPKHPSPMKAIMKSGTIRRGAALAGSTAAPGAVAVIGSGSLEGMVQQIRDTKETLVVLTDQAELISQQLTWLPWAVSGNALLIFLLMGLIARRYLFDRGYLS